MWNRIQHYSKYTHIYLVKTNSNKAVPKGYHRINTVKYKCCKDKLIIQAIKELKSIFKDL